MTCSFASKTRAPLDNIIFFTGPPSKKKGRTPSADGSDEWLDIDQVCAFDGDEGWPNSVAGLDWSGGLHNATEELGCTLDIDLAEPASTQAVASPQGTIACPHPAICSSQDQISNETSSVRDAPPATDDIRPPSLDAASAWLERLFEDGNAYDAAEPTDPDSSALADAVLASPAVLQSFGQEVLPSPPESARPPVGGDECPTAEQSQAASDIDTRALEGGPGSAAEREEIERGGDGSDVSASVPPPLPTRDAARLAGFDDDIDSSGDDSEDPVRPWRRRQTQKPSSASHFPASSAKRSRSSSERSGVERPDTKRRRRGWKSRSPIGSEIDVHRAGRVPTTTPVNAIERWAVQCFLRRTTIGSQKMITIELPAFALDVGSSEEAASPTRNNVTWCSSSPTPAPLDNGRGARFSQEEEDELIRLKEQSLPKLSWKMIQKEMHKCFPSRTVGSLQVHYCTRLKGRRPAKRLARRI